LPLGATFAGLFLLTFIFKEEMTKFDAEERLRIEAARNYRGPDAEKSKPAKKNRSDPSESVVSGDRKAKHPEILPSKSAA
jgi:hypothetical protein